MTEKLESGKGGNPAATPEAAKPKNKWFGVKNGLAVTVGVAAVAALLFAKNCGQQSGQDRLPPPVASVPAVVQAACPTPQPNTCNLALGEHDTHSPNWAPEKCGYCGDNIQQQWETAENCPVDFHCGDGVVNRGTIYGAYIAPVAPATAYSLGTVTVTETCTPNDSAFCEADCPTRGGAAPATSGGRRTGTRRDSPEPGTVATTRPPTNAGGPCDAEVTSRFQNRVSSSLLGNPGAARSAADTAGSAGDKTVRARVSISISNGVPSVSSISLSCPGCSGGSLSPGSVNVGGIPIDRSTTCNTTISVNIPPG
ncbi:hypothetical protein L0Y65_04040 [Candidatus Micrarchaeota archaeon]|nr:hypothetical protein [Candidatus Micrarchaeota archaeon]